MHTCMTYLPLIRVEGDTLLARLHLAPAFIVFPDVDDDHALEFAHVHVFLLSQLQEQPSMKADPTSIRGRGHKFAREDSEKRRLEEMTYDRSQHFFHL